MFIVWFFDQEDREDAVGALVRAIQRDYNNGCISDLRNIGAIFDHFQEKHPIAFPQVKEYLARAMDLYIQQQEK
jgi:hypothetical protein